MLERKSKSLIHLKSTIRNKVFSSTLISVRNNKMKKSKFILLRKKWNRMKSEHRLMGWWQCDFFLTVFVLQFYMLTMEVISLFTFNLLQSRWTNCFAFQFEGQQKFIHICQWDSFKLTSEWLLASQGATTQLGKPWRRINYAPLKLFLQKDFLKSSQIKQSNW